MVDSPPPAYEVTIGAPPLGSRRPSIHLRTIVEAYMFSRRSGLDGSIHKALNTNDPRVTLDPSRHKWVEFEVEEPDESEDTSLEPLYKDIEKDKNAFLEAMTEYESKADAKYKVGINIKDTHSIKDVVAAVEDAKLAYDEKGRKGFFAPLRKAFRTLGENESACQAWLELLPGASEYFSIICGGLKLILGAAKRLRKINDEIVSALVQIPEILSKSRRVLAMEKPSPKLRNYSSALYVAVLHAMGHILQYYQEKAGIRHVGAFIMQDSFQKTLLEKIELVTWCSNAIDREAKLREVELVAETNQVVKKSNRITEGIYEKSGAIQEKTQEVYNKAGDIHDSVEKLRRTWSSESEAREKAALEREKEAVKEREQMREKLVSNNEEIQAMRKALDNVADLLEKSLLQKDIEEGRSLFPSQANPTEKSSAKRPTETTPVQSSQKNTLSKTVATSLSPKQLLSLLRYEKEIPRIDMRANLRLVLSLSLEEQDQAVCIMQSTQLQAWLRTPNSSILLVDGRLHGSGGQRTPLSFVCAKLANSLRQARHSAASPSESMIINLYFFCGEHRDWRDNPDNGPAAVMNSLLAQLLTQCKHFDLSLIKHLSTLDSDDLKALGNIFGKLLTQLSSDMIIFCIVDGVSFYDDSERSEDCQTLLKTLIGLSRRTKRKGSGVFKILLTAPHSLRVAALDDLEEEEVLRIPEGVGKMGGFNALHWDIGAGQEIEDLSEARGRNVGGDTD